MSNNKILVPIKGNAFIYIHCFFSKDQTVSALNCDPYN